LVYSAIPPGSVEVPKISLQRMGSYSAARKSKERFSKYRRSFLAKAKKSDEHDAKVWILFERHNKFYAISDCRKDVSATGGALHVACDC
jgi:hypothetical protein